MSTEAISVISSLPEIVPLATNPPEIQKSFGAWLNDEVGQVNQQLISSDSQLRKLALGEADSLHQVMISLEEAKLSFQLMVQIRNRLLEGYQDIMRMQV